jgi:hypothetical protein
MPSDHRAHHVSRFNHLRSKFQATDPEHRAESTPLLTSNLKPGEYRQSGANDVRSPCPVLNALANHGYLHRDGRNITSNELNAALIEIGIAWGLRAFLVGPTYNEYFDPEELAAQQPKTFLASTWANLRNPWTIFSNFGLWRTGQVDFRGNKVIHLDQLATPGVGKSTDPTSQRHAPN